MTMTIIISHEGDKVIITAKCKDVEKVYTILKGDKLIYNIDLETQILLH